MKLQITIEGRAYEVDVQLLEEDAPPLEEPLPPAPPAAFPEVPADADAHGCRSPVNGLLIKVNVMPGQQVEAGELLAVVEAMKMETNLSAARAGRVKAVHGKPGDAVKAHQLLVELEEDTANGNG